MHGVSRNTRPPTEEEKAKKAKAITKYNSLKHAALKRYQGKDFGKESDELTASLIALNPDFYTLWNFRRCIFDHALKAEPNKASGLAENERKIVESGLRRNPKSYSAWHHRAWLLEQGHCDPMQEIQLCNQLLGMDSRNFHCWNYRQRAAEAAYSKCPEFTLKNELDFTTEKINDNFSNYSAWHYRSVLIKRMLAKRGDDGGQAGLKVLEEELSWVKQALYTDPEDQSAWLYYRWLLGQVVSDGGEAAAQEEPAMLSLGCSVERRLENQSRVALPLEQQKEMLSRELEAIEELREEEPDCKWVLLTVALLKGELAAVQAREAANHHSSSIEQDDDLKEIFETLKDNDGLRTGYYNSLAGART